MRYVADYNGQDRSAEEQFQRLSEILNGEMQAEPLYRAPDKPRIGRIVVADGTEWDPLSVGKPRLVWYDGTNWVALNA